MKDGYYLSLLLWCQSAANYRARSCDQLCKYFFECLALANMIETVSVKHGLEFNSLVIPMVLNVLLNLIKELLFAHVVYDDLRNVWLKDATLQGSANCVLKFVSC